MDGFEIVDPRFTSFVLPNAPLAEARRRLSLARGPGVVCGPPMFARQRRPRTTASCAGRESGGVSVFRQPSDFANGHTRDQQGRLIGCSHHGRRITRTELDGTVTVLADRYQGKRLNSPNDIVCKCDGTIWFTDPHYGINTDYEGGKQEPELPPYVYRLDPRDGSLHGRRRRFRGAERPLPSRPTSACSTSPRAGSSSRPIRSGTSASSTWWTTAGASQNRANSIRFQPGFADGFRADEEGNIWSSAADGVHCIDPAGHLLGKVKVPCTVSNLTFGGRNRSRLFLCASHTLYAIFVNKRGAQWP